ncbi:MAG TPA: glycosyltransferase, partial [Chitinophagaceae bacterium]|nr:glycosyltransferase [Chitinophagaceae bacterium]
MHIWLISAFEPTPIDKTRPMRFMNIANTAIQRGHTITFFSTTFKHGSKSHLFDKNTYRTIQEGKYELILVHSKPYKKNISFERIIAHYDLGKKLLEEVKQQKKKPDIIYISLPPLSTVDAISKWGKENKVPIIVDIIDPWPDVFLKVFPPAIRTLAQIPLSPFYRKLKRIMNTCSGLSAISEQYVEWAKTFTKRKIDSAFFYPAVPLAEVTEALNKLSTTIQKDNSKLRIVYTGSLASSYDIPCILNAAALLEKKFPGKTEFIIAGAGPQEKLIKESNLTNIKFLGWIGQEEMYKQFYLSDIGLTQHVKGATQSVTYKLFDYLSAGLPILNSLESEMADIIADNKVGFNNKCGDAEELATNIERFLMDKALLNNYKHNALSLTASLGDS